MSKDGSTASPAGEQLVTPLDSGEPGPGSIDKIREILFGTQARDYDKRLTGLEDRILKELAAMQEETRRRFDAFEQYFRNEVDALSNRLRTAQQIGRAHV